MYGIGYGRAHHDLIDTADSLLVPPAIEPLDIDEVKKQRRFSSNSLDTLFDLWIPAARQHFEAETGRQCIDATWGYWLDEPPCDRQIEIPHPPLLEIVSVTYDDGNGDEQTFDASNYRVINPQGDLAPRGRIALVSGASWPSVACQPKAFRIQYRAGYGSQPGDVPELTRYALMMLVGHFHKFGEEVSEARANILQLPIGAQSVISSRKFTALPTLPPRRWNGWGY